MPAPVLQSQGMPVLVLATLTTVVVCAALNAELTLLSLGGLVAGALMRLLLNDHPPPRRRRG